MFKDTLKGGKADKKKPEDFPKDKLEEGMKHEMEHTNDKNKAIEIAMDHLTEDIDYYSKLKGIEKKSNFFKEWFINQLKEVESTFPPGHFDGVHKLKKANLETEFGNEFLKEVQAHRKHVALAGLLGALAFPALSMIAKKDGVMLGDQISDSDTAFSKTVKNHPYLTGYTGGLAGAYLGNKIDNIGGVTSVFGNVGYSLPRAAAGAVIARNPDSGIGAQFSKDHPYLGPALFGFVPGLSINNEVAGEELARQAIKEKSFMYNHPYISSVLSQVVPLPGFYGAHTHAAGRILAEKDKLNKSANLTTETVEAVEKLSPLSKLKNVVNNLTNKNLRRVKYLDKEVGGLNFVDGYFNDQNNIDSFIKNIRQDYGVNPNIDKYLNNQFNERAIGVKDSPKYIEYNYKAPIDYYMDGNIVNGKQIAQNAKQKQFDNLMLKASIHAYKPELIGLAGAGVAGVAGTAYAGKLAYNALKNKKKPIAQAVTEVLESPKVEEIAKKNKTKEIFDSVSEKANNASDWIKENPGKTVGFTALPIMAGLTTAHLLNKKKEDDY